jgi:hypothetical protein
VCGLLWMPPRTSSRGLEKEVTTCPFLSALATKWRWEELHVSVFDVLGAASKQQRGREVGSLSLAPLTTERAAGLRQACD